MPPGATVVPVILATDKTLITKLRGDVSTWPVYITIGNISRDIRRKQTVPSKLLLGFILVFKDITKSADNEEAWRRKAKAYHESMRLMLYRKPHTLETGPR